MLEHSCPMLKSFRYAQSKWPYDRTNITVNIYEYSFETYDAFDIKVVGNFPGRFSAKLKVNPVIWGKA